MATRSENTPGYPAERGPIWDAGFVVLWVFWTALAVNEYVGTAFSFPAFVAWLFGGLSVGIAAGSWRRLTATGRRADRLYRDAPIGQQIVIGLVIAIPSVGVGIYAATLVGFSTVLLQVGFVNALAGSALAGFVSTNRYRTSEPGAERPNRRRE
jgi:hypothetical protein